MVAAPPSLLRVKITVIGCGYLGATHAACMAELGHEVLGVEIDEAKRASLTAGEVPFYEPHLADLLEKKSRSINDEDVEVRRSKLLRFAASRGFETELVFRILKEIES